MERVRGGIGGTKQHGADGSNTTLVPTELVLLEEIAGILGLTAYASRGLQLAAPLW